MGESRWEWCNEYSGWQRQAGCEDELQWLNSPSVTPSSYTERQIRGTWRMRDCCCKTVFVRQSTQCFVLEQSHRACRTIARTLIEQKNQTSAHVLNAANKRLCASAELLRKCSSSDDGSKTGSDVILMHLCGSRTASLQLRA